MTTVGLEPTIFGSEDRRLIHWAKRPCRRQTQLAATPLTAVGELQRTPTRPKIQEMRLPGIEPGPAGWKPAILTTRPQTLLTSVGAMSESPSSGTQPKKLEFCKFTPLSSMDENRLCRQVFLDSSLDLQFNLAENGLRRGSNPGPPAPEAGIIPLDHEANMCRSCK